MSKEGTKTNSPKKKKVKELDDEPRFHKLYPQALDLPTLQHKIYKPLDSFSMKFKPPGFKVLNEMINTRIMEESVSESPFKGHIM